MYRQGLTQIPSQSSRFNAYLFLLGLNVDHYSVDALINPQLMRTIPPHKLLERILSMVWCALITSIQFYVGNVEQIHFDRPLNLTSRVICYSVFDQRWKCCKVRGFWSFGIHYTSQVEEATAEEIDSWKDTPQGNVARCGLTMFWLLNLYAESFLNMFEEWSTYYIHTYYVTYLLKLFIITIRTSQTS